MGAKGEGERITILHKNVPNMIGQFTAPLAEKNMNIEVMTNKKVVKNTHIRCLMWMEQFQKMGSAVSSGRRRVESKSDQISELLP